MKTEPIIFDYPRTLNQGPMPCAWCDHGIGRTGYFIEGDEGPGFCSEDHAMSYAASEAADAAEARSEGDR